MESTIKIWIDRDKCTGCGLCAADCLRRVIEMKDYKARVIRDECLKCGHCLAVCPANAVRMDGIEDVILENSDSVKTLDPDILQTHLNKMCAAFPRLYRRRVKAHGFDFLLIFTL